jgi:hypothetical protein
MDQRERAMFFGVRPQCRIARKMISAQTQRGYVAFNQLRHGCLHRGDHILRAPWERHNVTVIDQTVSVFECIIVWPALIIQANVAGLLADRARAKPRTGTVRGARIERYPVNSNIDLANVLCVACAPERNQTLVRKPAQYCGGIDIFGHG